MASCTGTTPVLSCSIGFSTLSFAAAAKKSVSVFGGSAPLNSLATANAMVGAYPYIKGKTRREGPPNPTPKGSPLTTGGFFWDTRRPTEGDLESRWGTAKK